MLGVKFDKRCANNTENDKTVLREINKTYINREIYCIHGLEDSVLLRCQFFPQINVWIPYHANQNLSKFTVEISQL